ncbi:MAG: tRNA glutamyl-Q synthetase [Bacteroidetes bacterium]|nr:tRNA glutamyl-Q synthetase [Bacteroidota bacterium]
MTLSDIAAGHQFAKTRIAPTPSGYLHLGNVLSFALTAALARKTGAKILLRIDDMDRERVNQQYVQDIFDTLNFLEIPWDEGPRNYDEFEKEWSQRHRLDLYQKALQKLRENGEVFACLCSRAQVRSANSDDAYPGTCRNKDISLDMRGSAWRLKTDAQQELQVNTLTKGLIKTHLPIDMTDFVVRKKDGYPAYQLTSLIDDLHFGVDLIVRGQDLWHSTLAQLYLSQKLKIDFARTTFCHHPLIEISGKKLSKSAGDTSIKHLRESGKKPVDIYTEIAAMFGTDRQINNWEALAGAVNGN